MRWSTTSTTEAPLPTRPARYLGWLVFLVLTRSTASSLSNNVRPTNRSVWAFFRWNRLKNWSGSQKKFVASNLRFPKAALPSSSTPYPHSTNGWEATAWPFDVLLIQRPGNWSKRLGPSRPRAPMNPVKHLPQPPKKRGLV